MKIEFPNILVPGDALVAQVVGGVLVGSGHPTHVQKFIPADNEGGDDKM